ncbi:uncharacterized protein EAE97_006599 [Botrytis byssoidea]|uniref:Uncharacterized protein n=1 Tax=Botrytis byssoidea TaxID=139641 RepID=A0A9P5M684_9HELO|nr:uncharacterized protein EAE97_006599 [Botrytis byssoidea]KAF7941762.1 hypothetical protein EAE97_006599 [Botrytis byssoidea]
MAHRNTGSYSMHQMREDHRHQLLDVNEFLKKKVVRNSREYLKHPKPPEPQCHDVLDLTKLLERTINASSRIIDSALGRKRTALDLLRDRSPFPDNYTFSAHYGRPQPYSPLSNHDHATEVDLEWLFAIFNTIFFMNALPTNTEVIRQDSLTFNLERRVILPERENAIFAGSSPSAFVDNVHAGFERRDDHKFLPPTINVPSSHIDFSHTEHVVPWEDQVGSLLGSMIDLFIQYYSCRQDGCWNNKYTHGKKHRGEAWQIVAYRFETSITMKHTQEALGSPINLRREDYEWDLNYWSIGGLDSLEQIRALRESFNSRSDSGARGHRLEGRESRSGGPQYLFDERGSRFRAGGYGLEGISEEGETRARAAPFRSRRPENRTELGVSQYGGSESRSREDAFRSREDGSRSKRLGLRGLFRRTRGQ